MYQPGTVLAWSSTIDIEEQGGGKASCTRSIGGIMPSCSVPHSPLSKDMEVQVDAPRPCGDSEAAASAMEVKRAPVDAAFPSMGSAAHGEGLCKPCAFSFSNEGWASSADCIFCHLCLPGEKKRRKKAWKARLKVIRDLEQGGTQPN